MELEANAIPNMSQTLLGLFYGLNDSLDQRAEELYGNVRIWGCFGQNRQEESRKCTNQGLFRTKQEKSAVEMSEPGVTSPEERVADLSENMSLLRTNIKA
ncbi:hypothetical protein LC048_10485 [Mesobacillus subterraneus]|uniref:hypothetical protein n=1 Tax=Mesobacillus subterraneus TaxID=285983 RepID=UPI001CFC8D54|nr:hypothetical protein [Mesobacillus subterraneus]WLR57242.1 hypothetical protein LC048_10485 [Mesobacillus subterraneus]